MKLLCAFLLVHFPVSAASEGIGARLGVLRSLVGEKIEYDACIHKTGIWLHVGEAVFSIEEQKEGRKALVVRGVAQGGKFGYHIRMLWETFLDPETLLPFLSVNSKTGSERRFERYLFLPGRIIYFKKKHCRRENCTDPSHVVRRTTWFGPIPTGSESVHCPGCKDLRHYVWRVIWTHKVREPFLDMLGAVYAARTCRLEIGSSFVVPVVKSRDRWRVKVTAVKEEQVKVPAGTFQCVKVTLEPQNVGDRKNVKPKFSGLFGIKGTISIWIDQATRIPVRIKGTIPFAFFDLYCDVSLRKIHAVPEAYKLLARTESGTESAGR